MNAKKKWYAKAIRAGTGVTFRHRPTSIPGTHVLEANWEYSPVPIASMWYAWSGKHSIAILEMYTARHYRRLGVQTKILLRLLNDFADCFEVTTESATPASKAWLERAGFGVGDLAGFILKVPSRHPHFKKTIMPLKQIKGPYGQADQYDIKAIEAKRGASASLIAYCVNIPWANVAWHSYQIALIHLREVPGFPPAKKQFHGATHEIFIHALDPEVPFNPAKAAAILKSTNYAGQFISTDAEAIADVEKAVEDIVNGDLSPDTDYTQHWIKRFGASNIKGDPARAGETIIVVGNEKIVFDPAPLTKKPKDTLCRFCGMPAVAVQVVGTDACLRCATIHQDKIDVRQTLIYKLMKKNVTRK